MNESKGGARVVLHGSCLGLSRLDLYSNHTSTFRDSCGKCVFSVEFGNIRAFAVHIHREAQKREMIPWERRKGAMKTQV